MKYLLLLLCLSTTTLFAQKAKYFSPDSVPISKGEFNEWHTKGTLPIRIAETKDTVYYQAVKRYHTGKLSDDERDQLYNYLSSVSGMELNKQLPVLLLYHQGNDPCNLSGAATISSRRRWFDYAVGLLYKKTRANVMVMYTSVERVAELYPDIPAYYDKYRVLGKFFKYHYPCGSIMVINPNGNIAYYFGEYGPKAAVDLYTDTQTGKQSIN